MREASALYGAPLCPDWLSLWVSPIVDLAGWRKPSNQRISPLEGEMSGRTEGGATERHHCRTIILCNKVRYFLASAFSRSTAISTRSGVAGASSRGQILW